MAACGDFEQAKPGVIWGGMPCKNCDGKKKDHPEPVVSPGAAAGGARADNSWIGRKQAEEAKKKQKPENVHAGTHQGSLAHFVGKALGVKHEGKSSGLMKRGAQADGGTVMYHSNRAAAKEMSKTFGEMFMAASLLENPTGKDGKSVMRASEVAKKQRELQQQKQQKQSSSNGSGGSQADSPRSQAGSPSSAAAAESPSLESEADEKSGEAEAEDSKDSGSKKEAEAGAAAAANGGGSGCPFESDKPGMVWGGSVCGRCGEKKKDHQD